PPTCRYLSQGCCPVRVDRDRIERKSHTRRIQSREHSAGVNRHSLGGVMRQSIFSRKSACCAAVLAIALTGQTALGQIVISQLFGGSSTAGPAAAPNGDFIELFNRSCVAVNLDNYS